MEELIKLVEKKDNKIHPRISCGVKDIIRGAFDKKDVENLIDRCYNIFVESCGAIDKYRGGIDKWPQRIFPVISRE